VQPPEAKGFILGQIDRKVKDRKFSRSYVVINHGPLKGLKAKVITSDDNIVKLEILSNNEKIVLNRDQVTELKNPSEPIPFENGLCPQQSFDDAAKLDMGTFDFYGVGGASGLAGLGGMAGPYNNKGCGPLYRPTTSYGGGVSDLRMTKDDSDGENDW
jgi:ADP-heptose:LPS heptosyltransferase